MGLKAYIRTFGCQMNKNDSDIIARLLQSSGIAVCEDPGQADIYIVNTCSVRGHAERRALGYITSLKPWRSARDRALCVAGCMAQRLGTELLSRYPYVDLVLGPDCYQRIGQDLLEVFDRKTRVIRTGSNAETYAGVHRSSASVKDYVSITRGCSNYCSYCVVPFVRGPVRSRDPGDIEREVNCLVEAGAHDITLLGQNVNEYRSGDVDFARLLGLCARVPGLPRLRFLTSHPKDFNDSIIEAVAVHRNICEWFHLPLQSGSDRILGLMNRKYKVADYRRGIEAIRRRIPGATVTTDIIVGFPTETEAEYRETLSLVEEMRFDDAYTYRYSARPGTKAGRLEPLPEPEIKQRLEGLIALQSRISLEKMKEMAGKEHELLFEKHCANGTLGRTRGNTAVLVEKRMKLGSILNSRIVEIRGRTPVGIIESGK